MMEDSSKHSRKESSVFSDALFFVQKVGKRGKKRGK